MLIQLFCVFLQPSFFFTRLSFCSSFVSLAGTLRSSSTWRRRPGSLCSSTAGTPTRSLLVGLCIFKNQVWDIRDVFSEQPCLSVYVCMCHRHHEEEQGPMCRRSGEDIFTVITLFRQFAILFKHNIELSTAIYPNLMHSMDHGKSKAEDLFSSGPLV